MSLLETTRQALSLLLSGDADLWSIIGVSFRVSLIAILIAAPPAVLLAFVLTQARFPGRRLLIAWFNTLLSIPAVVVGLTLYLLLSRQGPMGNLQLLFTQTAMILGKITVNSARAGEAPRWAHP